MKKITIAILTAIFSLSCFGQQAGDTSHHKIPYLNGHSFPTVISVPGAFINTSFKATIGLGQTSKLKVPGIRVGEYEIFTFEGRLMYVNLNVNYQQKFNDWLALRISLKLAARLGTDMSMILVDGVNTLTGGEIGWVIKIYESEKVYLSTLLGLRNLKGSFINVTEYFEELINHNPDPSVTKVIPALGAGASLNFAYAMSPTFGMQISGIYIYGESFVRGETEGSYDCGIAFDADLQPDRNVPIGFMLGYSYTTLPEIMMNYDGGTNMAVAGLYFTGSDDFELSLQYEFFHLESRRYEGTALVSNATIVFRYYF